MAAKFKVLTREDIEARVSMLIYGFPGAGKTFLARSLLGHPSLYPALVLVCDAGELTLKTVIGPGLDVVRADLDVLTEAYDKLTSKGNKYKSVFIDNLTELHRTALMNHAKKASEGKPRTEYELTMQDYGVARNQILTVAHAFATTLPHLSVFVTCAASEVQDEASGTVTIEPNLSGKLSMEVPGYFDVVGYLSVQTPTNLQLKKALAAGEPLPPSQRILQTNASSKVPVARNRGGLLGDQVINPTLPELYLMLNPSV